MTRIETVVLDLAGTTVTDDGLVQGAFELAWDRCYPDAAEAHRTEAIAHVVATMGQSKIEVFRALVDEDEAEQLNAAFEAALDSLVENGAVVEIPGADKTILELIADGRQVVFTTGFSRATAEAILQFLGWQQYATQLYTPADAGRGRPSPGMNLLAAAHTGVSSVAALAVVGDTESDARSGVNAGAGMIVAVLSGGHASEQALRDAGAQHVLASVAELPALLRELSR